MEPTLLPVNALFALLATCGVTYTAVARHLDVDKALITKWVQGKKPIPSARHIALHRYAVEQCIAWGQEPHTPEEVAELASYVEGVAFEHREFARETSASIQEILEALSRAMQQPPGEWAPERAQWLMDGADLLSVYVRRYYNYAVHLQDFPLPDNFFAQIPSKQQEDRYRAVPHNLRKLESQSQSGAGCDPAPQSLRPLKKRARPSAGTAPAGTPPATKGRRGRRTA